MAIEEDRRDENNGMVEPMNSVPTPPRSHAYPAVKKAPTVACRTTHAWFRSTAQLSPFCRRGRHAVNSLSQGPSGPV